MLPCMTKRGVDFGVLKMTPFFEGEIAFLGEGFCGRQAVFTRGHYYYYQPKSMHYYKGKSVKITINLNIAAPLKWVI